MIIRPSGHTRPTIVAQDHVTVGWPRKREPTASFSRLRLNYLLWFLLVLTNVTDVLASKQALARGAVELNPIVARLLEAHGIMGLVVFKSVWLALLLVLVPFIKGSLQWLYAVISIAYLLLAAYHLYHI